MFLHVFASVFSENIFRNEYYFTHSFMWNRLCAYIVHIWNLDELHVRSTKSFDIALNLKLEWPFVFVIYHIYFIFCMLTAHTAHWIRLYSIYYRLICFLFLRFEHFFCILTTNITTMTKDGRYKDWTEMYTERLLFILIRIDRSYSSTANQFNGKRKKSTKNGCGSIYHSYNGLCIQFSQWNGTTNLNMNFPNIGLITFFGFSYYICMYVYWRDYRSWWIRLDICQDWFFFFGAAQSGLESVYLEISLTMWNFVNSFFGHVLSQADSFNLLRSEVYCLLANAWQQPFHHRTIENDGAFSQTKTHSVKFWFEHSWICLYIHSPDGNNWILYRFIDDYPNFMANNKLNNWK